MVGVLVALLLLASAPVADAEATAAQDDWDVAPHTAQEAPPDNATGEALDASDGNGTAATSTMPGAGLNQSHAIVNATALNGAAPAASDPAGPQRQGGKHASLEAAQEAPTDATDQFCGWYLSSFTRALSPDPCRQRGTAPLRQFADYNASITDPLEPPEYEMPDFPQEEADTEAPEPGPEQTADRDERTKEARRSSEPSRQHPPADPEPRPDATSPHLSPQARYGNEETLGGDLSTTRLLIFITISAATAGLLAMLLAATRRLGAGSVGLVPLFSRVNESTVLAHPSRKRLADAVGANPGITLPALAECVGLSRTTVAYHLRNLERYGAVKSSRMGKTYHYFPTARGHQSEDVRVLAALKRHEMDGRIAAMIIQEPGTVQKELSRKLGLYPSRVHSRIENLHSAGLIRRVRRGRHVQYFPTDDLRRNATAALALTG